MKSGPTLVILHGWGQSSKLWVYAKQYLPNIDVIAYDLPGFGDEPIINQNWGIPEYAQWAKEKIATLGHKNIVLLGHSFGGRISSQIASQNPPWLSGLILYASPSIYRPNIPVRIRVALAHLIKKLGIPIKYHANLELINAKNNGLDLIFKKSVSYDQTTTLRHIQAPTLLVWGENDKEVPISIAAEINELIQGSQLKTISDAGHNAHLENPTLFYGTIKQFIENH